MSVGRTADVRRTDSRRPLDGHPCSTGYGGSAKRPPKAGLPVRRADRGYRLAWHPLASCVQISRPPPAAPPQPNTMILTRQSLAAPFEALARVLSIAGRVAISLLRHSARSASGPDDRHPRPATPWRCTPAQPAVRLAQGERKGGMSASRAATPLPLAGELGHALRGTYRVIPISAIAPAPRPSRLIYEGIERLAVSIAGDRDREGLGLLSPIVVRVLDDGRYECVDGHRRLHALQLIAKWAGAVDSLVPAIVFNVSARVAELMRVAALDAPEPKPIELALIYRALRDAVAADGSHACSARALTSVVHHGKTQLAGYLRIADTISDDVMRAAGLVTNAGIPTPEALVDLTRNQLLDAAKPDTVESRAAALKGHLDRQSGQRHASSRRSTGAAEPQEGIAQDIAHTQGRTLSLIARTRTMQPSEARAMIENEVAPAMIALVEQAHGGRDAEGYYSEFTNGHACLVLPRDVEGLTLDQLDHLDHTLAMLASRARRAREERLRLGALLEPSRDRMTS